MTFSTKWNDHMKTCLWKCCKLKATTKNSDKIACQIYMLFYSYGVILYMVLSVCRLYMSTEKWPNARIQCLSFKCWHHITNKKNLLYEWHSVDFLCCKIQTSHSNSWPLTAPSNMCMVAVSSSCQIDSMNFQHHHYH